MKNASESKQLLEFGSIVVTLVVLLIMRFHRICSPKNTTILPVDANVIQRVWMMPLT